MKIEYRTGDLLEAPEPAIVHGCNAQGVMGSGVAKAIRAKYPKAYNVYAQRHRADGLVLGDTIWVDCDSHVVINAITQDRYGRDGKRYADYDAIERAFKRIDKVAELTQNYDGPRDTPPKVIGAVGMPLIGAGLAGGSWTQISAIIEACANHFQPVVYLIDGKMPTS